MQVNDRVKFIGPEYKMSKGPTIGQLGTIIEIGGYKIQIADQKPIELITVFFDGDEKPTVLSVARIEVV